MARGHAPRDRREHRHMELPARGRRRRYLPREIFFFGFGFVGISLPAAFARAFCFFVATRSSGSMSLPAYSPADTPAAIAPHTATRPVKGTQKPKKMSKKRAQKTLKERRAEKRVAAKQSPSLDI
jgi:hypothetical protein